MKRGLLIRSPDPGWGSAAFEQLFPGGHAIVFGSHRVALEAEEAGFEVRDCIVVMCLGAQQRAWLFRKPVEQQNVAQQVLRTGTGGLWIDGCRVATEDNLNGGAYSEGAGERWDGAESWRFRNGGRQTTLPGDTRTGAALGMFEPGTPKLREFKPPAGRWPPNLVFVHGPKCRNQGTRGVRGGIARRGTGVTMRSQITYGAGASDHKPGTPDLGYVGSDGLETVQAWDCQAGCPVAALDQQSLAGGMHSAGTARDGSTAVVSDRYAASSYELPPNRNMRRLGDSGGASRFFPQFANDQELDGWLLRLILGPS